MRDFLNYLGEIENLMALIVDQHSFISEDFLPMLSYIDVKCSIENQLSVESDINNFQREELKVK